MIRVAEPQSRVCSRCGQTLPINEFRFRKRGEPGRQGCCRDCYNDRMRAYRFARRSKAVGGFSQQVLRASGPQAISRLCAGMFRRFGGADGVASVWMAHLTAAPAGSRIALNSFRALARLMEVADAQQQPADCAGLTDAELDQELQRLLDARESPSEETTHG